MSRGEGPGFGGRLPTFEGDSGMSESVSGASCSKRCSRLFVLFPLGTERDKNLGIGREDAAGEA